MPYQRIPSPDHRALLAAQDVGRIPMPRLHEELRFWEGIEAAGRGWTVSAGIMIRDVILRAQSPHEVVERTVVRGVQQGLGEFALMLDRIRDHSLEVVRGLALSQFLRRSTLLAGVVEGKPSILHANVFPAFHPKHGIAGFVHKDDIRAAPPRFDSKRQVTWFADGLSVIRVEGSVDVPPNLSEGQRAIMDAGGFEAGAFVTVVPNLTQEYITEAPDLV